MAWIRTLTVCALVAVAPLDARAQCEAGDALEGVEDASEMTFEAPRSSCADVLPTPIALRPARPIAMTRALVIAALVLGGVLAWQVGAGRLLRSPRGRVYVAGAGLGGVLAVAEGALSRPLSASGAFDHLAVDPIGAPTWPVWLMIGVLIGSFASSRHAREARLRWLPDAQWVARFGRDRALRLGIAFVGAMLVQIGADIAGGCTAGLALSGGAVLAPAAFLFMAGMFAGGMPVAWLIYRGRRSS